MKILEDQLGIKDQEISNYKIDQQNNLLEIKTISQKLEFYSSEAEGLNKIEARHKEELDALQKEIDKLQQKLENSEEKAAKFEGEALASKKETENTKNNLIEAQHEITDAKNQVNLAQQETNIGKLELGTLTEELNRAKSEASKAKEEEEKYKSANELLQEEINNLKSTIDIQKDESSGMKEEIKKHQEEIDFYKDIINKEVQEKEELKKTSKPEDINKIEEITNENERLKITINEYESKIIKLDKDNEFLHKLVSNKEEVVNLQTRYTYASNLLNNVKGSNNADPQLINFAESVLSDGKTIFTKDESNSLIPEDDLLVLNRRMTTNNMDNDTYNLSKTNSK